MDVIANNIFHEASEEEKKLLLDRCCEYEHNFLKENMDNLMLQDVKET
jgi:phosphoglycolate phosphatase